MRNSGGSTWIRRIFSRQPQLVVASQDWVLALVRATTEQQNAATIARDLEQARLSSGIEASTIARDLEQARLSSGIEDINARASAQFAAQHEHRQTQEFQLAAALEEIAARFSSKTETTAAERERDELRTAIGIEEMAARMSYEVRKSLSAFAERNERRMQIGSSQAMSYADSSVSAVGKSLKAVAKALASLNRQVETDRVSLREEIAASAESARKDAAAAEAGQEALQEARQEAAIVVERLEAQLNSLQDGLKGQSDRGEADIAALATSIAATASDCNSQLRSVEDRVEFVRKEIMYELQASLVREGGKFDGKGPDIGAPSRILNTEKVDAMRGLGLRLNLGCGHIPHADYINVDSRELPGVDVVAEVTDLPFADENVAEIMSSHLVEHFSSHVLDRVLLPYWKGLLSPGGQLTTIAPDGAAMLKAVNAGTMTYDDFKEVLFGGQEYDGDFHYNLLTPEVFSEALSRAGFTEIETIYAEKRNGKCFEFKTIARKP